MARPVSTLSPHQRAAESPRNLVMKAYRDTTSAGNRATPSNNKAEGSDTRLAKKPWIRFFGVSIVPTRSPLELNPSTSVRAAGEVDRG